MYISVSHDCAHMSGCMMVHIYECHHGYTHMRFSMEGEVPIAGF